MTSILTDAESADLKEIVRLLDEAYAHAFACGSGGKGDEGYVGLHFNNVHDRRSGEPFRIATVDVYSYVLGPHRMHHFDSTAKALEAVREWHTKEMSHDPNRPESAPCGTCGHPWGEHMGTDTCQLCLWNLAARITAKHYFTPED